MSELFEEEKKKEKHIMSRAYYKSNEDDIICSICLCSSLDGIRFLSFLKTCNFTDLRSICLRVRV